MHVTQLERFFTGELRQTGRKFGRRAGIIRNNQMLDTNPDLVLAFCDGQSKGTQHTINEARKRGLDVEVIRGGIEAQPDSSG